MNKLTLGLLAGASLGFVAAVSFSGLAQEFVAKPVLSYAGKLVAPSDRLFSSEHRWTWRTADEAAAKSPVGDTPGAEHWVPATLTVTGGTYNEVIAIYDLKTGKFVFAQNAHGPEAFIAAVNWAAGKTCVTARPMVPDLGPVPKVRGGPLERFASER